MESLSVLLNPPFTAPAAGKRNPHPQTKIALRSRHRPPSPRFSAVRTPKGFGPSPSKKKNRKRKDESGGVEEKEEEEEELEEKEEEEEYEDEGTIPEVVTNRMMRRMGLSVGSPLVLGLLFFPFFYYLKVVAKVDVPSWVPVLVSFFFFGTALMGVSYGIVSSSWDPTREGSILGWNEARRNWPVFWQSLRGGSGAGGNTSGRRRKR